MIPPAISIWRVEAFILSTIVVSDAATIIVKATIKIPAAPPRPSKSGVEPALRGNAGEI